MPGDSEESAEAIWTWPACRQSGNLAKEFSVLAYAIYLNKFEPQRSHITNFFL